MFQQYSPKDVVCSWNGVAITGFAPDSFLRLQRTSDLVAAVVGAGGDVSLTRNADRTGTIEIELMQTASSNLMLSGIYLAQQAMELEEDISSNFVIFDPSGSVMATGRNAWLQALPQVELAKDQTTKTWTFGCEHLDYTSTVPR
ncbi:structural protein [Yersinia phage vB_YenM_P778]